MKSNLMKKISVFVLIVGAVILVRSPAVESLTFDDGTVHNINYPLGENFVTILDNVNPPYNPTVVNFLPGAGFLWSGSGMFGVSGHSIANVITLSNLNQWRAGDESIVNLWSGGYMRFDVGGKSTVTFYGGSGLVDSDGWLYDNSKIIYYAGGVDDLWVTGSSNLFIYGGGPNHLYITGGHSEVFGGLIGHLFDAGGDLVIYGGSVGGWDADYPGNIRGSVTIYGNDFNVPVGTYTSADNLHELTGVLSDGTPLGWEVLSSINLIGDGGTIRLIHVSEPTTILLLGSGLIGLAGYGRKKFFKK